MEIKVNYLDNLRIEAKFDDFTVIADQPIRYKGDGSAPGPFDYFLASSESMTLARATSMPGLTWTGAVLDL